MAIFSNKKTEESTKKVSPKKEEESVAMSELYSETASKSTKGASSKVAKDVKANQAYRILVKPLITEKATQLSAENKYVFVVALKSNKIEIAKAIQAVYGVKPVKVNLSNVSGKKVTRGKIRGQRKDWRKAIVTLAKGQTIKIYEGV